MEHEIRSMENFNMPNSVLTTRVSRDPRSEFNRLQGLQFGPFARPLGSLHRPAGRPGTDFSNDSTRTPGAWVPPVDIYADDSSYKLAIEIPGTKREDVSVEVHERILTIKGSKERGSEEPKADQYHLERKFGSFERRFRLPEDAKNDGIQAAYRDGILSVEVPKREESKPTNVAIAE